MSKVTKQGVLNDIALLRARVYELNHNIGQVSSYQIELDVSGILAILNDAGEKVATKKEKSN